MSEIAAYHEAGHAFMAIFVGARVRHVTIQPDRDDGPERHADIQVEWPLYVIRWEYCRWRACRRYADADQQRPA